MVRRRSHLWWSAVVVASLLCGAEARAADRPSDAPPKPSRTAAAAATGATTLKVDQPARLATLRVDDGFSLDHYQPASEGPITFQLDLHGIDPNGTGAAPLQVRMSVFDVDQAGAEDCGPEVDAVSVNGKRIGTLSGANDQSSTNSFTLPVGTLNKNVNTFRVDIDTGGTGCWAVTVAWAEVKLPFNLGQLSTDAADDKNIRRGKTTDTIPDRVWERAFDASGALGAPTKDDPIADAMQDSHWIGADTAGKFTYKYALGAWPSKPDFEPTVRARWVLSGGGGSGSGPAEGITGWDGKLEIPMPQRTGKYDLTVFLEVTHDGGVIVTEERKHTLYVLLGSPVSSWIGADTGTPKTAWLDQAFAWGAGGKTLAKPILEALAMSIHGNSLKWTYEASPPYDAEGLIEGRTTRGECVTFVEAWIILARSVGIDADDRGYAPNGLFLTTTRPALDGNAAANVSRAGGPAGERWEFKGHVWGTYAGTRYDPTFGVVGTDTPAAFEADSVYCKMTAFEAGDWTCQVPGGDALLVRPTGMFTIGGWPEKTYTPIVPLLPRARAAAAGTTAVAISDVGVDVDGNGRFDHLRVDVPVTVPAAGEYTVLSRLLTAGGANLGSGTLDPRTRVADVTRATLTAGTNPISISFLGRPIFDAGQDGPWTVAVQVLDASGATVASYSEPTSTTEHGRFQTALARLSAVTDTLIGDQLRVSVPVTPTAPGRVGLRATLFAGDTEIASADRQLELTTTPETATFDFSTAPLWATVDGPYTVRIEARDAFYGSGLTHTTAAYDADAFPAPPMAIGRGITDQGVNADLDGRFQTLALTVPVSTATPTTLTAEVSAAGRRLVTASTAVAAGSAPVVVAIDGSALSRADGPYDVVLSTPTMTRAYTTAPYSASAFTPPAARLTGGYADAAVDTNADGHPDVLRVTGGVRVAVDGDYSVRASLVDAAGREVAATTAEEAWEPGDRPVTLDFSGAAIAAAGSDGPYRVTGVVLSDAGGELDATLDAHRTAAYTAADFRAGGALAIASIADRGVDLDGDGTFERLAIDVTLDLTEELGVAVNGRLVDSQGDEIAWTGAQDGLDVGRHVLTLEFDGSDISGHGVDGPYRLEDLSVYFDADDPLTQPTPYTTAAYRAGQFQAGDVITGHVTANGTGVAGAVVAAPGVAYDITDASGAYRLALPGGSGPYQITITADPALAPWTIFVDGLQRATGNGVSVEVPDGETTVDFRHATSVSTSVESTVGGTVPATLAVALGAPPAFAPFVPGQPHDYEAATVASVTSTAGDATLSVTDGSSQAVGHLLHGAFALPSALELRGEHGAFAPLTAPVVVSAYDAPVTNDMVDLAFRQRIAATDALRTGRYEKTVTITLSTTTP